MNDDIPLTLHSFPRALVHIDGDAFFASCEHGGKGLISRLSRMGWHDSGEQRKRAAYQENGDVRALPLMVRVPEGTCRGRLHCFVVSFFLPTPSLP